MSYANVVASVALFIALGGVSVAATGALAPGSVGKPQLAFAFSSVTASQKGGPQGIGLHVECSGPPMPKCGPPPSVPQLLSASINLNSPGPVEVVASTVVKNKSGTSTNVTLFASLSGAKDPKPCSGLITLSPRAQQTLICAGAAKIVSAGRQRLDIFASVAGGALYSAHVTASHTQATAWTLPPR